jgi:hypothetical protein
MKTKLSERQQKAIAIAAHTELVCKGGLWLVPSQSGPNKYTVNPDPQTPQCSCPDFEARQLRCKHIYAVEITLKREYTNDGDTQTVTETLTVKKKYRQEWASYNQAQQTEKSHFLALLYQLCS